MRLASEHCRLVDFESRPNSIVFSPLPAYLLSHGICTSAATPLLPNLPLQERAMGVGGWEAREARGRRLISKNAAPAVPLGIPALGVGKGGSGTAFPLQFGYVIIALIAEVK